MSLQTEKPIGVIYEHAPEFNPVLTELSKRGIPWTVIDPSDHYYNPALTDVPYRLIVNDMSNPPYTSRTVQGTTLALDYTRHLEQTSIPRIQGRLLNSAYTIGILANKSHQLSVFAAQGLRFPVTRIINSLEQLLAASSELTFPLLIRPNKSWTNLPPLRINSITELIEAFAGDYIYLDRTESILVQSFVASKHDHIVRVETINGNVQHAVRIYQAGDSLGNWPLEVKVEHFKPNADIVQTVEALARAARLDIGAIEYTIDRKTDAVTFLGIRPHTTSYSIGIDGVDQQETSLSDAIAQYIVYRLGKVRELELAL